MTFRASEELTTPVTIVKQVYITKQYHEKGYMQALTEQSKN